MNADLQPPQRRPRRPAADSSRMRNVLDPELLRVRGAQRRAAADFVDGRGSCMPPSFAWGSRDRERAAEHAVPGLPQHQRDRRRLDQPDEGRRAGTRSRAASTTRTATRRSSSGGWSARSPSRNDTNNPLDTTFGFANAALGVFSSYHQCRSTSRGTSSTTTPRLHPGQLEGEQPADARLRRALRAPAAAVRRARARRRTSCPSSGSAARRRCCTLAGCAERRVPVHRRQPAGAEPGDRPAPRAEHGVAIGTLVPNSGNTANGLFLSGEGIAETTYTWPALASRRASGWPTT